MRSFTHAPLPNLLDLYAASIRSSVPDDELAAPWCRSGDSAYWFSRSAWSLLVVARWKQQLLDKQEISVWLPDFFCNAALDPLREIGVNLVFYPVNELMAPNIEACQALVEQQRMDLFVLVHYFGQPTCTESAAIFCKKHKAWLIEDAAHVLRPAPGIGEAGDCVIYSPHKHLAIPDGAVLVVRPNGPAQFAENNKSMSVLNAVRDSVFTMSRTSAGNVNRAALLWLFKRLAQRLGLRSHLSEIAFKSVVEAKVTTIHPRMSIMAKRLLSRLLSQLDTVATHREQHAKTWANILSWKKQDMTVTLLTGEEVPYLAGFSTTDAKSTENLFNDLQREGLPVTTWPDLPPEVLNNADAHQVAIKLRYTRFYLPVHQTLLQHQLLECGKRQLKRTTLQWQAKVLSHEEWEVYWQRCPMANLLQSYQYGEAKKQAEGWKPCRLLIVNENKSPIALVQVLTRVWPILGGVARLNRGPLLFVGDSLEYQVSVKMSVMQVIAKTAQRKHWWLFQVAPELPDVESAVSGLQALGFKKLPAPVWESGLISLDVDEKSLLMGLNGKWRNSMRKGVKLGVTVTHQKCNDKTIMLLMQSYAELQNNQGFSGMSEKLIRALAKQKGFKWQFNIFIAHDSNTMESYDFIERLDDYNPLGMVVTIRSGDTAIYLIGTSNDRGRSMQANSVLLWEAILHAKRSACCCFDIGGLSDATPKGVATFKRGLNASPYKLVGEWRKSVLPMSKKASKPISMPRAR